MRRAVGDAAGLTIKGQLRRAAEHLGYEADAWRVREAFYGRAGSWSAAALDELRRRAAAWQQEAARTDAEEGDRRPALARRVRAIRQGLMSLARQVEEVETEISRPL